MRLDFAKVPLLPGVKALASQGMVTGASGRNWAAYGAEVALAPHLSDVDRALLSDPQTSGGLLVSCASDSVADVLAVFRQQGFGHAAEVGEVVAVHAGAAVRMWVD